ncbi:class II aaRS and biotin synthetase [Lasiosphaeria ovina]|uniref:Lysyl-tRNA synthetase n=1 Tax=Lasiosphaeria ovina TaxID=92902 RepID=A0AAE0TWY7_9PEZI|nr:class II aaRS and biotin synthetase [Lasiosphaeria ovina]
MRITTPSLSFLRPYAWRPLEGRNAAYLRFYHLARPQLDDSNAPKYPRIRHDGVSMRIPTFREKYKHVETGAVAEEEVTLHGRVQWIRRAGSKLVFLNLKAEFEQVQGLCNFRKLESTGATLDRFKELSRLVKRGDIISVTGKATRTPTGELTIEATRLPELMSPTIAPLPFQLANEDTRIQLRHVDMLVNRKTIDTLRLRSYIIRYMRDFLDERGFLEFQTPILADHTEGAVARPFTIAGTDFPGRDLTLRIAPELWLKRLVVGGVDKVFELGPAFRNEGIDLTHNPEFTTCEFYNAYASLDDLIALTEDLIRGTAEHCQKLIATKLDSLPAIDVDAFRGPFTQMEFIPSLESSLGCRLPDLSSETAREDLAAILESKDIAVERPLPTLPQLLDRLSGLYMEPHSLEAPLFITNHPMCMSPLSKSFMCPKTGQAVSARTELFVRGRELANMYEEENDPAAQRQKFLDQAKHRLPLNPDGPVIIDESYVQALESGLPPTGGWGCGIERLVMLFSGASRISECLSFGNLKNVMGMSTLRAVPVPEPSEATSKKGQ